MPFKIETGTNHRQKTFPIKNEIIEKTENVKCFPLFCVHYKETQHGRGPVRWTTKRLWSSTGTGMSVPLHIQIKSTVNTVGLLPIESWETRRMRTKVSMIPTFGPGIPFHPPDPADYPYFWGRSRGIWPLIGGEERLRKNGVRETMSWLCRNCNTASAAVRIWSSSCSMRNYPIGSTNSCRSFHWHTVGCLSAGTGIFAPSRRSPSNTGTASQRPEVFFTGHENGCGTFWQKRG